MRGCSERPRGDPVRALGDIFQDESWKETPPNTLTRTHVQFRVPPSQKTEPCTYAHKKISTVGLINTYSLRPPSHSLWRSCYLDNPPPLRCGQAQILGVLVLLNSRLKSLAGLAHRLQNVRTQLKIAAPAQREPLSWLLCLSHQCARM